MKVILVLSLILLTITAGSCIKDDLTLPSEVSFIFELETDEGKKGDFDCDIEVKASPVSGIEEGTLIVNAIEFDGRRAAGRDVSFVSAFPKVVTADLIKRITDYPVDFDIPQGIYNSIDITLHLDTVGKVAFLVSGTVKSGPLSTVPFSFEYGFPDMITVRARPVDGSDIVLRRDRPSVARVKIDIGFMFRFVNPGSMASADMTTIGGVDYVVINSENNIALFNQIAARMTNAIKVTFE